MTLTQPALAETVPLLTARPDAPTRVTLPAFCSTCPAGTMPFVLTIFERTSELAAHGRVTFPGAEGASCTFTIPSGSRAIFAEVPAASRTEPEVGDDGAGVVEQRRHQHDVAAVGGLDGSIIDDEGEILAEVLIEVVVAAQEITIGQRQRARHQAAHIHLRALAEQYAVGVDKEDPPVR